jgi:hypothetical protein
MNETSAEMRIRVLLSLQRALLGMVTPSLQGVAVAWEARRITGRFIYDADGDDDGIVREVETEVLADFEDDVVVDFSVEVAASAAAPTLGERETWAYLRRDG